MKTSAENLEIVSHRLWEVTGDNLAFKINYDGYPTFRVQSMDPLVVEGYGRYRHKPPHLLGEFALVGLVWRDQKHGSEPYGILEVRPELYYGATVDMQTVVAAAEFVQYPLEFSR